MNALMTFDSTKEPLLDMLRSIGIAKTQLPDFQRGWVWDDEHIRSLLASISLSYPVGMVMMLETGNEEVRFKPRLVEGVENTNGQEPERLILDGQQRLTSLYLATLSGKPVPTKDVRNKPISRWYYIDIQKSLSPNGDRDDAIVSLAEDRIIRNFQGKEVTNYSTPEHEFKAGLFPMQFVFGCAEWRRNYSKYWNYEAEKIELFDRFEAEVIKRFEQYQMPLILLRRPTPKEAVCQVFEKVNTGGVSLTVFELLTATFATDDYNLRDDWHNRERRLRKHKVLQKLRSDDLIQAITLLATYQKRQDSLTAGSSPENAPGISCKRKEILRLTLADYLRWAEPATNGFEQAARLLHSQKIFSARDLPYQTQLIPLASVFALLGDKAESDSIRQMLARWLWCGIFGELYGSTVETRFARDLPEILVWVNGGMEPSTVSEANFVPSRLLTLRTRNSAAYKGLHAVLLRDGALDFRSGEPIDVQMYFDNQIDIHHIFPRDWCIKQGKDRKYYDSVVNKTPLSARTNRIAGGKSPGNYIELLQQRAGIEESRMDEILESHLIYPLALRLDDFEEFFRARERDILERIERAMGKSIIRDMAVVEDVPEMDTDEDEEDDVA